MSKKLVWFDFENAPHVWVLKDIIIELSKMDIDTVVTARKYSSTVPLSQYLGLHPNVIGCGGGKNQAAKMFNVLRRSFYLYKFIYRGRKPDLAVSHGSRSQALTAFIMGIPAVSLDDYEHSFSGFNIFIRNILSPFPIKKDAWGRHAQKVVNYPGLKEELYLWNKKNYEYEGSIAVDENKINVLFRPEGRNTHYSTEKSRILQDEIIGEMSKNKNLHVIFVPRDPEQKKEIIEKFKENDISYSIPENVLNGPALIKQCDMMIGGGGTMTREATALEVPSYSFFGGTIGLVDKYLTGIGKLVMLEEIEDIKSKIVYKKKETRETIISSEAFLFVKNYILNIIK